MTTLELISKLQSAVRKDPDVAWLPVMLAQYDSESASQNGYEPATGIDVREDYITIN